MSIQWPGDEGLTVEENKVIYEQASNTLINLFQEKNINILDSNILEVGCGGGYYTQLFYKLGAKKYTGLDITEILFPQLRRKFPGYTFIK